MLQQIRRSRTDTASESEGDDPGNSAAEEAARYRLAAPDQAPTPCTAECGCPASEWCGRAVASAPIIPDLTSVSAGSGAHGVARPNGRRWLVGKGSRAEADAPGAGVADVVLSGASLRDDRAGLRDSGAGLRGNGAGLRDDGVGKSAVRGAGVGECGVRDAGVGAAQSRDAGMSTVEYAVGTVVAAAFAAVLYRIVTGDSVVAGLTNLVNSALSTSF